MENCSPPPPPLEKILGAPLQAVVEVVAGGAVVVGHYLGRRRIGASAGAEAGLGRGRGWGRGGGGDK